MSAPTNLIHALDKMGPREQAHALANEIATHGGIWSGPMGEGQLPLNTRIAITCHGISAEGATDAEAVAAWIACARATRPDLLRATDRRLDCPYNGAGALA